jgi:hypothetical protein
LSHDIVVEIASSFPIESWNSTGRGRWASCAPLCALLLGDDAEFVTCHPHPANVSTLRGPVSKNTAVACESVVVCFRPRNYILRILIPHGALYFNMQDFWSRRVMLRRKDDEANAAESWFLKCRAV